MLITLGNLRTRADAFGALGLAHLEWRTWFSALGLATLGWQPWFGNLGLAALVWQPSPWRSGACRTERWHTRSWHTGRRQPELGVLGRHSCRDAVPSPDVDLAHCWLAHLGVAHADVAILDAPLEPRGVAMSDRDWASAVRGTRLWHTGLRLTERRCFRVPLALSIEKLPRRG
jgi:hypothetical protein